MKLDKEEVKYIARLAKLSFTEDKAERLAEEFTQILSHFQAIDKIDLSDISLELPLDEVKTVLRPDEAKIFENKEKLFKNTKAMRDTYIQVPKIIE